MKIRKLDTYKVKFINSIVIELIVSIKLDDVDTFQTNIKSIESLSKFLGCEVMEVILLKSEIVTHN